MKKITLSLLIILSANLNGYSENIDHNNDYQEQWKVVLNLQRILDNGLIKEAPNFFSKNNKDKIINTIKLSPDFFVRAWKLDEYRAKKYKDQIFKGKGLFVLEDGEWKIDEI